MAENHPNNAKNRQLSLEEYAKVRDKKRRLKLKLTFPMIVKLALIVPLAYFIFLILYLVCHVRFLPEH